jgi:hypothetical protein
MPGVWHRMCPHHTPHTSTLFTLLTTTTHHNPPPPPPTHTTHSAQDLLLYGRALAVHALYINGGLLAAHPRRLPLPEDVPDALVVEPWVVTDPVTLVTPPAASPGDGAEGEEEGEEGPAPVQWAGRSRWVEVTMGLMGPMVSDGRVTQAGVPGVCEGGSVFPQICLQHRPCGRGSVCG